MSLEVTVPDPDPVTVNVNAYEIEIFAVTVIGLPAENAKVHVELDAETVAKQVLPTAVAPENVAISPVVSPCAVSLTLIMADPDVVSKGLVRETGDSVYDRSGVMSLYRPPFSI